MNHRMLLRISLGYPAIVSAQIGLWALLAPRSFYDDYPGMGRTWVAVDGPYNEHLIRDVGALNLALLAVLVFALVRLTPELIRISAIALLVWGVPHLAYHIVNTDGLGAVDIAASLSGLVAFVAFGAVLLVIARNPAFTQRTN